MPESKQFSLDKTDLGFRLINLYPDGTFKTKVKRVAYTHQLDTAAIGY